MSDESAKHHGLHESSGAPRRASSDVGLSSPPHGEQLIGRQLNEYRVLGVLGRGANGLVCRAVHLRGRGHVALKIFSPERPLARLLCEACLAAGLEHPNIVRIHQVAEAPPWRFIAMDLVDGHTLRHRLKHGPAISTGEALHIAGQIVAALRHAHRQGVVHCDLKPKNLLIDGQSVVKLADFGLAYDSVAHAEGARAVGTTRYKSPEVCAGQPANMASDVYSLGVTLFELFAGRLPYLGHDREEMRRTVGIGPAYALGDLAPALPAELTSIIHQCLSDEPLSRPRLSEIARAIRHASEQLAGRCGNGHAAFSPNGA